MDRTLHTLDLSRHESHLPSRDTWQDKPTLVIGVGTLGCTVVDLLARLGFRHIIVIDDDVVESHNIANQSRYDLRTDIGVKKVVALQRNVLRATGTEIKMIDGRAPISVDFGLINFAFVCVDSMKARNQIVRACEFKPRLQWLVEGRLGVNEARRYAFDPNNQAHMERWFEESRYTDEQAAPNDCQIQLTLGVDSAILAARMVRSLMHYLRYSEGMTQVAPANQLLELGEPEAIAELISW